MRRLQKTIEELGWTKSVPRFGKADTVARAFDAMSRESHDCVLIVEADSVAGIFTSRDFLNRVAAVRKDPQKLRLGDVMTPTPEGYAVDKNYPDIFYVPHDAHFDLHKQRVSWTDAQGNKRAIKLLPTKTYVRPSGYKVRMEKPGVNRLWRLVGTVAEGAWQKGE